MKRVCYVSKEEKVQYCTNVMAITCMSILGLCKRTLTHPSQPRKDGTDFPPHPTIDRIVFVRTSQCHDRNMRTRMARLSMLRLYLAFFECSRTGTTSGTPPPTTPTDAATTTTSSTVTGSITINDIDL